MEKIPIITEFDRENLETRVSEIKTAETRRVELELELYELNKQKFDLEKLMGIKSEEPKPPYQRSQEVDEWTQRRKASVLDIIGRVVEFGQEGTVECSEHDSDDGIGFDSDTEFRYQMNEGVFCVASIANHRQFGWSGSKNELRTKRIICSPDMDFPLKSKYVSTDSIEAFGRTSWDDAGYMVGDLLKVLRWRRALDRMSKLINEKGALVILEGREPQFNREVKQVRFEDEIDTWTIQLGNRWQSYNDTKDETTPPIKVAYDNKLIDQGFNIQIEQNNIRPYIWRDSGRAVTRDNHMDYVEKVIDRIEELSS